MVQRSAGHLRRCATQRYPARVTDIIPGSFATHTSGCAHHNSPATASTAVPRSSTPSPPENIGPEAEPVAGVTRGREDIELLMQRGDHFLATRDVVSARSFYERAAAAGSTDAAFAMARTFDAQFLTQIGATHVRPDAERAAAWDHAAGAVGDHLMDAQLPAPRSPSGN